MKVVLTKLGAKVADESGSEAAKALVGYLGPILSGSTDKIIEVYDSFFEERD